MEKVNQTIDAICDWIQKELEGAPEVDQVSNMVKALAELVSARG